MQQHLWFLLSLQCLAKVRNCRVMLGTFQRICAYVEQEGEEACMCGEVFIAQCLLRYPLHTSS